MKRSYWIAAIILLAVAGYALFYWGSGYWMTNYGVTLKPSQEITAKKVPYFLQNDTLWGSQKIGRSPYLMGASGCLVADVAAVINVLGEKVTPLSINRRFTEKNVFNDQGEIIWGKIATVFPDITYELRDYVSSGTIESDLAAGHLPMVKVNYHKLGKAHWVVIVGATENDFLVMDPLYQKKEYLPLSTHGKVFAYRKLLRRVDGA